MDYAHWISLLRKFPWFTTLIGAAGIAFDRAVAFAVVPAALCVFIVTAQIVRGQLSIARFFLLGWLTVVGFLVCLSSMVFALARFEGVVVQLPIDWVVLTAIPVLASVATRYSLDVWTRRLENLRKEIHGNTCSSDHFFNSLGGTSQVRFWTSPFALSALSGVAMLGSWVGYRHGESARAVLVIGVTTLAWLFVVGSGVAQLLIARRYGSVLSVRLI